MSKKNSKKKKKKRDEEGPEIRRFKRVYTLLTFAGMAALMLGVNIMTKTFAEAYLPLSIGLVLTLLVYLYTRKSYMHTYAMGEGYRGQIFAALFALFLGGGVGFMAPLALNRCTGGQASELLYPIDESMMEEDVYRSGRRRHRRTKRRMEIAIHIDGIERKTRWNEKYLDETDRYDRILLVMHTGILGWQYYSKKSLLEVAH